MQPTVFVRKETEFDPSICLSQILGVFGEARHVKDGAGGPDNGLCEKKK